MIEFQNVTKKYGDTLAINRVSLKIPESGIYCLLGRNGAGKTTFMKLLAGHIAAAGGQVIVGGKKVSPGKMPESVNYIENGSVHFNMPVSQLVSHAAELQDDFDRDFANEMMRRFELSPKKKYNHLSLGMKNMLTAIISLSSSANVLLLDEPALGFDAIMRGQFNTLLTESYEASPRIIIVSTHLIDEIAKVAGRLIIIDSGEILLEAGIDEVDEKAYTLTGVASVVEPLIDGLNCIGKTRAGSILAAHIFGDRITPPESVTVDRLSLQDFFVNIVGGKRNE